MLSLLCIGLIGMYISYSMVGVSRDRASQWTVGMGIVVAKEASPVEYSKGWHFMEGFVWTGGGLQMLRRIRTELKRVGVPAGDQGKKVAIIGETDQRLVLGHLGKFEFKEICEPKLVHRKAAGGGVNLVQPVDLETANKNPRMVGVDMVPIEGAVENPMVRVVRDSIT